MKLIELVDPMTNEMADWRFSRYFEEAHEHPGAQFVHPVMVEALDELRRELGAPITVSPNPNALVSLDGHHEDKSWHYIIPGRNTRGMAADIMVDKARLFEAWMAAQQVVYFGGIGLYPFWTPKPGLHVDMRPYYNRALWWRDAESNYFYPRNHYEWKRMLEGVL